MHPILVEFGPITIRYYGLMYVVAISVGLLILLHEVRRKKIVSGITGKVLALDDLLDLLLWTVPAAIVGARIYYVSFQWQYYSNHLLDILKIWQGGLAIHGGVIGGIMAVYLFSRRRKIPFWALTDAIALSLILGQAIGRIGNLMNGDAYGTPTQLPWGIRFPASSPAGMAYPGKATHPSMIYEMILNMMIFGSLWQLRKRNHRDGFITALYFILYSIARFVVSFTRGDSLWLGPIRAAHLISAILIILFLALIISRRLYKRTTPETSPLSKNDEQGDHQ